VLQVPRRLYELLHTYALSRRAEVRRSRFMAKHGEHSDPYLFLTQQGSPYYTAKADALRFNPHLDRRHEKTGQPVRQFLKEHAIPYVREHHDRHFHYRIHDLRASFGMNITELLMELVQSGSITLNRARMTVKDLLWHESFATTDLYLNYRSQMDAIYEAVNGYGEQLQRWIDHAMKGMAIDE
jgi:polyhydroxyalkanoate synthesis regulator phasin